MASGQLSLIPKDHYCFHPVLYIHKFINFIIIGRVLMKKSINERIHDLRERSGLTQSDLAIQLGMTRSGVNAWEMGISKPSLENLVILSRILHTTTDYLLGNNNEETIVINDFTPEEKEMVMRMVHYIEEVHQLKCKKNSPPVK